MEKNAMESDSDVERIVIQTSTAILKSLDGQDWAFIMSVLEFSLALALAQAAGGDPHRMETFVEMHHNHLAMAVTMFGDEKALQ